MEFTRESISGPKMSARMVMTKYTEANGMTKPEKSKHNVTQIVINIFKQPQSILFRYIEDTQYHF